MPESDTILTVVNVLADLSVAAVFLYLYFRERKRSAEMADRVINMYGESIKASKDVAHALTNNTRAIEALTDKVDRGRG